MFRVFFGILLILPALASSDVGVTKKAAVFLSSDGSIRITVIRKHSPQLAVKGSLKSHKLVYEELVDGDFNERHTGPLPFHYFPYEGHIEDSGRFTYLTERTALIETMSPRKMDFKALPLVVSIEPKGAVKSYFTRDLEKLASGQFKRTRFLPLTYLDITLSSPLVGPPSIKVLCQSENYAEISISNPISVVRSCKT